MSAAALPIRSSLTIAIATPDGAMFFCINPHGVGNEVPYSEWKAYFAGDGKDYQYSGWEDREKCFFHGQALRAVRGLEWLKTRPEWNGRDLAVKGVSMGGSQSLQAAALDPDVTLCLPSDPALCDHAGFEPYLFLPSRTPPFHS